MAPRGAGRTRRVLLPGSLLLLAAWARGRAWTAADGALPPRRAIVLGTAGAVALNPPDVGARQDGSLQRFQQVIAEAGLSDWQLKDYEAMRDDAPRTSRFERAIQRRLAGKTGQVVVDIGTGPFALLAVMAAKAGAKKVYALEINPEAAAQARQAVAKQGLGDVVEVLEGDSMKTELPERADLVVSELIGSLAAQEGVEPIIRDAQRRFLKEGLGSEAMIPSKCQTLVAPVYYKGRSFLQRMTSFTGLRSRGKPVGGSSTPLRINAADEGNMYFLAEPQVLEDFDYAPGGSMPSLVEERELRFDTNKAREEGTSLFTGLAMWTRVVVDDKEVIEVRGQPDSHWAFVLSLLSYPQPVRIVDPGQLVLKTVVDHTAEPVKYSFDVEVPCV